jgi:hypothetical protein
VNPYWLEDEPVPRPSTRHEGRVDVAIVGAGVTGCAAARPPPHPGRSAGSIKQQTQPTT